MINHDQKEEFLYAGFLFLSSLTVGITAGVIFWLIFNASVELSYVIGLCVATVFVGVMPK